MSEPRAAPAIAFIDVEASGLGAKSWPVEAGWAFECGGAQSFLICPDPAWSPEAWDPRAQALHEISLQQLNREGKSVANSCTVLNDALRGKEVFSDAPDWDGFWLHRLFSTAGLKQEFRISDFATLMRPIVGDGGDELMKRAENAAPRRHRAGDDARHLQAIYRLAIAARGS